jgi:hypothetical protein
MARVSGLLAFAAVLVACLAGAFSVSWWLACIAAAMLLLVSLSEQKPAGRPCASRADAGAQTLLLLSGTLNAATATAAGFVAGRALATLCGV